MAYLSLPQSSLIVQAEGGRPISRLSPHQAYYSKLWFSICRLCETGLGEEVHLAQTGPQEATSTARDRKLMVHRLRLCGPWVRSAELGGTGGQTSLFLELFLLR